MSRQTVLFFHIPMLKHYLVHCLIAHIFISLCQTYSVPQDITTLLEELLFSGKSDCEGSTKHKSERYSILSWGFDHANLFKPVSVNGIASLLVMPQCFVVPWARVWNSHLTWICLRLSDSYTTGASLFATICENVSVVLRSLLGRLTQGERNTLMKSRLLFDILMNNTAFSMLASCQQIFWHIWILEFCYSLQILYW